MRITAVLTSSFYLATASSAFAGRIQDYVDAHGACSSPAATANVFDGSFMSHRREKFGLSATAWTEDDIAELRLVYANCLKRWPVTEVPGEFRNGEFEPEPGSIEIKVNRQVADLQKFFISPAQTEKNSREVAAAARQRLEKADTEAAERARDEEIERQHKAAEAAAASARAQHADRREAMRRQAEEDRGAAEQAQRLAAGEEADLATTQRDAEAAHDARLQAEKRLALARQSAVDFQQRRAAEDRQAAVAGQEQRRVEHQAQERQADDALARTCAVSADQFKRVSLGMTLHQVRETFGCAGTLNSSMQIQGVGTLTTYQWDGTGSGFSSTVFSNGRVVSKAQTALE